MNEFKLYDRIINGDLRPHLDSFSGKDGVESLIKEFYSREIILAEDSIENFLKEFPEGFLDIKSGDRVKIEMNLDGDNPGIVICPLPNENEQELFNLDIPPAPDEKSEIFLQIIEDEYRRLKKRFQKRLNEELEVSGFNLYASKYIQQLKVLAKSAYRLKRKLEKQDIDDYHNPDTFVIEMLCMHLVYLILDLQNLFFPLTGATSQSKGALEDELFDYKYSKMKASVGLMNGRINENYLKRLKSELPDDASLADKCKFWLKKLTDQFEVIQKARKTKWGVSGFEIEPYELFENEFGVCLYDYYYEKLMLNSSAGGLIGKYERAIVEMARLKTEDKTMEYRVMQKFGFFEKIQMHIDTLKERISVLGSSASLDNILADLISFAVTIQARKHLKLKEDQWNDYLTDLLRAKQYHVADQSRSGRSGSAMTDGYQSGNLDITIRDQNSNGVIRTAVETLQIDSCGDKDNTVKSHIDKLLKRYDTAGNRESYLIVLSRATDFSKHWEKYKSYVQRIVFNQPEGVSENLGENGLCVKSDVKIGSSVIERSGSKIMLYHIFVNMHCSS